MTSFSLLIVLLLLSYCGSMINSSALIFLVQGINTVCTAKIYVAGTLNHEYTNRHTLIVRATDSGGLFVATKFTISVLDVNDPPRVSRFIRHLLWSSARDCFNIHLLSVSIVLPLCLFINF